MSEIFLWLGAFMFILGAMIKIFVSSAESTPEDSYSAIAVMCIGLIIFIVATPFAYKEKKQARENQQKIHQEIWNDGIHDECGGKWKYVGYVYGKGKYCYICNKCEEQIFLYSFCEPVSSKTSE